ncbi:MAG TPA: hypothetical protein VJS66_02490 [Burkholderiales bacterium]|nr:hypothetical protein [Burkholderiales bacterium]
MSNSIASTDGAYALQRWRRVFGVGVVLYPLAMHVLIVYGQLSMALFGLALVSLIAGVFALSDSRGKLQALSYALIAVAAAVGLVSGRDFAFYLPSIVFNLFFASVFALTLRSGETPMVERFMRVHHGEDMVPELVRFARHLTCLWAVFCIVMSITSAVLAVFASLEAWSLFANVINYALIVLLFIGQFVYGFLRHRALTPTEIVPTAARTAARMARRAASHR